MAYPPAIPAPNITNATAQGDRHPTDHNALLDALNAIVAELGANPKGDAASVTGRLNSFASVDGLVRDANAAWGVQKWQASANGQPAQTFPPSVDTPITVSGFAPLTGDIAAGRLYRLEGIVTVQGQSDGTYYGWSLKRDGVLIVQGAIGPLLNTQVATVPLVMYQRVSAGVGAPTAGSHTYSLSLIATNTGVGGKVMHPCALALTDAGPDLPGAGPASLSADFTFDMDPPE